MSSPYDDISLLDELIRAGKGNVPRVSLKRENGEHVQVMKSVSPKCVDCGGDKGEERSKCARCLPCFFEQRNRIRRQRQAKYLRDKERGGLAG